MEEKLYAIESRSFGSSGKDHFVIKATSLIEALNKFTELYSGIDAYWLTCYELKEEVNKKEIKGAYELYFLKDEFEED